MQQPTRLRWLMVTSGAGVLSGLIARSSILLGAYVLLIVAYFVPFGTMPHPHLPLLIALAPAVIAGVLSTLIHAAVRHYFLRQVTLPLTRHPYVVLIGLLNWPVVTAVSYWFFADPLFLGEPDTGRVLPLWLGAGVLMSVLEATVLARPQPADRTL